MKYSQIITIAHDFCITKNLYFEELILDITETNSSKYIEIVGVILCVRAKMQTNKMLSILLQTQKTKTKIGQKLLLY